MIHILLKDRQYQYSGLG